MTNSWLDASLFVGGFSNLKVQVTSNAQTTITVDSIVLKSSDRAYVANAVSLTNTITTSGVNGLDTGSEASSTWYNVWIIYNGTTVASLLSLSATAPTMPSGYTYKARVGVIRNDGSSNLWRTLQQNENADIIVGTNPATILKMANGTTSNTSVALDAVSVSNFVPPTASRIRGYVMARAGRAGAAPNNAYGPYGLSNAPPVSVFSIGTDTASSNTFDFALESTNIYWFCSPADDGGYIVASGWKENL